MEVTLQSNIDAFNAAFREYLNWTTKQPQEALERKIKNIGIRLWRGFTAHQFGGVPRQKGIALAQLAARTAEGRGTKVRGSLLDRYRSARNQLLGERRDIKKARRHFGGHLDDTAAFDQGLAANSDARQNLWRQTVGEEVKLRQSGIGYLGAAFLWYRKRGKGDKVSIVQNRVGKPIGSVEVGDGQAVIIGEVAGLSTVDSRYGVIAQAINDETDDTMTWVKEQQDAAARRILGNLAA